MPAVMVTKKKGLCMTCSTRALGMNAVILPFLYQMTSVPLHRDVGRKAGGSALCSKCFGIWEGDLWMRLGDTKRWIRVHLRSHDDRENGISKVLTY